MGFEPMTYHLRGGCSARLSYSGVASEAPVSRCTCGSAGSLAEGRGRNPESEDHGLGNDPSEAAAQPS